ncbi:MAG: SatD family protein [Candidatus Polarisedimenticolia bacterium]
MARRARSVAVLTADVVGSSRYSSADRRKLDRIIRLAFAEVERRFPGAIHTQMAFRITAGDEFQCVIADAPRALDIVAYLRAVVATGGLTPPVRLRASVGIGAITTPRRANPYEEDGPAFVNARQGLEEIHRARSLRDTALVTRSPEVDAAADAVLSLMDFIQRSWTVPQWEAVRWSLLGFTREAIASKLKVAHQNVTKRLRAAGWPHCETAWAFLRELIERDIRTRQRVQKQAAPR